MKKEKITRLMYSWSKYGGGQSGLVKENLEEWACQSCARTQRRGLPSYMIEISPREFVRICAICKHKMISEEINDFWQLINKIRSRDWLES